MIARERVLAALKHEPIDRTPRDLAVDPAVGRDRPDEVAEILLRFPPDVERADYRYPWGDRSRGRPPEKGDFTDAWGCVWHVHEPGAGAALKTSPLADLRRADSFRPPVELLDRNRLAKVNRASSASSRFVLAWTEVRPLDRLRFLHGPQAALDGLLRDEPSLRRLLAEVHGFFCDELRMWAESEVDGVVVRDEIAGPTGAFLPPAMWQEVFGPLFRDYCEILHAGDKFVFFHSDGAVDDVLGELVEVGVDAVHARFAESDYQRLAQGHRKTVTFWSEIDQARLAPMVRPEEAREGVRRLRRALDFGRGGVIALANWSASTSIDQVAAVFDEWMRPLPAHA